MSKIYAEDVIRIAAGEIGYLEKATNKDLDSKTGNPGKGNWTKYARDLFAAKPSYYNGNKNGYDWCAVFVDWCLYRAAGNDAETAQKAICYTGPYGAGCKSSVIYYKEAKRFNLRDGYIPKPGDQIFFGASAPTVHHTGLVERVTDGVVYTIEGNSGNAVRRKSYSLKNGDIYGYGRPKYDGDKAPAETDSPETGFPFADVPRNAYYRKAVEWAHASGLTAGTSKTEFSPDREITRAEAVTMLYRLYKLMEGGG